MRSTVCLNRQASEARAMLDDLLEASGEMLVGLFARKMRDMYKVKMLDAGLGREPS